MRKILSLLKLQLIKNHLLIIVILFALSIINPFSFAKDVSAQDPNPFLNEKWYIDPNSRAKQQADAWRSSRPTDAQLMDKLAQSPSHAMWFGNWSGDIESAVNSYVTKVKNAGALPILVIYNIPQRDCGLYSAGGSNSPEAYREWIKGFARGLSNNKAIVILEPDALGVMDCLSDADKVIRKGLLKEAVQTITTNPSAKVYIDISHWLPVQEAANRLTSAGIASAQGFVVNVSNFEYTNSMIKFGKSLSPLVGNKSFIIDTSRNGLGPWLEGGDEKWCNPPGRALGPAPTTTTSDSLVDAYVWIKSAGESDGTCHGGPAAGTWWPEYALNLVQRSLSSTTPPQSPLPSKLPSPSLTSTTPQTFTFNYETSSKTYSPGDIITHNLSVKSSKNVTVLIDLEIFDTSGTKVFQQFYDKQRFQANTSNSYTINWQTTNITPIGNYTIKVGVFNPNWQGLLTWNDHIDTIVLSTQPTSQRAFGDIAEPFGKVDIFDYNQLITEYGKTGTSLKSDIDKMGISENKVDIFDYNLLLQNIRRH